LWSDVFREAGGGYGGFVVETRRRVILFGKRKRVVEK
jgi:hypothetical protein